VLHGLNDWGRVNGHPVWILVVLVSGILFLGYAKVGSRSDLDLLDGGAPAFMLPHERPARHPLVPPDSRPGEPDWRPGEPAEPVPGRSARYPVPTAPAGATRRRPWWEH
jgi:hypothetical protein